MTTILCFHTSIRQAWRQIRAGINRFAVDRDWHIQIIDPGKRAPDIRWLIEFWKPVGCIVECSAYSPYRFDDRSFGDVPTVFIGRDPRLSRKSTVTINHPQCGVGALAAKTFLASGYKSFAFLANGNSFWSRDHEADFRKSLRLNGFRCAIFGRQKSPQLGTGRTKAIAKWMLSLQRPCGLLAENDGSALEAINIARHLGISIPDQLAIIGSDNDPDICESSSPRLSSIQCDFEYAGHRSCELLALLIAGKIAPPVTERYQVLGLMRRETTPSGVGAPRRIAAAIEYIRANARTGISSSDVLAQMDGSRRHNEILFRQTIGHSIMDEILRVRFEAVELMLRDRSRSIGAIANLCGWKNTNSLRASFIRHYGMSMRDFRANALR